MESHTNQVIEQNENNQQSPPLDPTILFRVFAGLCILGAIGFGIAGYWRMQTYDTDAHIVGGDAYNYTIIATRGVGLACIGIICAVLACAFLLLSETRRTH
jgi:hypothetical protein